MDADPSTILFVKDSDPHIEFASSAINRLSRPISNRRVTARRSFQRLVSVDIMQQNVPRWVAFPGPDGRSK